MLHYLMGVWFKPQRPEKAERASDFTNFNGRE